MSRKSTSSSKSLFRKSVFCFFGLQRLSNILSKVCFLFASLWLVVFVTWRMITLLCGNILWFSERILLFWFLLYPYRLDFIPWSCPGLNDKHFADEPFRKFIHDAQRAVKMSWRTCVLLMSATGQEPVSYLNWDVGLTLASRKHQGPAVQSPT